MTLRVKAALIATGVAIVFITLLSFILQTDSLLGTVLLDKREKAFYFPFTVQNIMWILFFIGLGELFVRYAEASAENAQVDKKFLPEDPNTLLQPKDLGQIVKRIRTDEMATKCYLQKLLSRVILQFQSSRSIDQANSLMNSSIELYQHEIDLKYSILRYVVWLIPTMGFIGTVIGISMALNGAGDFPGLDNPAEIQPWMKGLTLDLGMAFYTTLVALVLSAILMFLLHIIQEREELALNRVGQYCMDNLITRLYIK